MATIKQIDGRTVHQIQSGQVIVDLCSVVKELLENSIDAGASNVDVRFKNQGLDLVEVQDNGAGISPANYASIALKHHTSKLSSYADIGSLETFGFRGEALASLCAMSTLTVTTCLQEDAPKGSRLSFETSGKLKGTSIVAAQRGTTVTVEKLFHNLPVRRRELERNIKREWHKVINLLNQYACIQTNTKFTVSQQPTKGRRIVLFSTKGNPATRDNIINIFGAKTMSALVPLNMSLEMQPTNLSSTLQSAVDPSTISKEVRIVGHVSRPTHGDGRQTPDRQMFFINGRPCSLPQFAKTFNEVYKSYNSTQSPFIFADIQLDTHLYDVNVSPDKRTILLHDQNQLLDTIRSSLVDLFDSHDYAVPTSRPVKLKPGLSDQKLPLASATTHQSEATGPLPPDSSPSEPSVDDISSPDESPSATRAPQSQHASDIASQSRSGGEEAENLDRRVKESEASGQTDEDAFEVSSTTIPEENVVHRSSPEMRSSKKLPGNQAEVPGTSPAMAAKGEVDVSGSQLSLSPEPQQRQTTIPVIQPIKGMKRGGDHLPQRSPAKRAPKPASIVIGNLETLSESKGSCHIDEHDEDEDSEKSGQSLEEMDEDEEGKGDEGDDRSSGEIRPSFSTALSHSLAAGQGSNSPLWSARSYHSKSNVSRGCFDDSKQSLDTPTKHDESLSEEDAGFADDKHSDSGSGIESDGRNDQDDTTRASPGGNPKVEHVTDETATTKPRLQSIQGGSRRKDATLQLSQEIHIDEGTMHSRMKLWLEHVPDSPGSTSNYLGVEDIAAADAESKLSLIISKSDFGKMRVAGQFNMGFIIAVRPGEHDDGGPKASENDELFIIDQHASDEKYNFERLQDTTVVQSQRLVHPKRLELTALEEEIVIQNTEAIEANGFKIEVNTDGEWSVGSRCQVTALPLSRETTFSITDLEELISLLGDESSESKHIPRPSKVRKMFAMRACRSSIMIGKALTPGQMYALVGHMGELDKPWNCPHGRPTMRHLCRMQTWDEKGWTGDVEGGSLDSWVSYGRDGH